MKATKFIAGLAPLSALALTLCPPAQAQTVEVVTAGSSAQFGVFAAAAYKLAGSGAKHYTVKSSAFLRDERKGPPTVPDEVGNLWVVWNSAQTEIWAYLSVDSVVGVRAFESAPRAHLQIPSATTAASNALNIWSDGSADQASIPTAIYNKISDVVLTAANTDIRPEDALYATNRALATTANGGLGYTEATGIKEATSIGTGVVHPSPFVLTGTDPLSTSSPDPFVTIPVGAAPIVFLANANSTATGHLGSSAVNNLAALSGTTNNAAKLFSGAECDASLVGGSSSVAVSPILREPTSGTMNTTEFTTFQVNGGSSQETGVTGAAATNPLQNTCTSGGGTRYRAIGTGDEVKGISGTTDALGYVFFSYEAVPTKTIGQSGSYKYLELDGHDPLQTGTYSGTIPSCLTGTITNCVAPIASGKYDSFDSLRAGTYTAWSVYRLIADYNNSGDKSNAQTLVNTAQTIVDTTLPDFVPLAPVCNGTNGLTADEPGLQVYRKHFAITSTFNNTASVVLPTTHPPFNPTVGGVEQPNDGPNLFANSDPNGLTCSDRTTYFSGYLGGVDPNATNTEVGGDVGGAIVHSADTSNASVPGATQTSTH